MIQQVRKSLAAAARGLVGVDRRREPVLDSGRLESHWPDRIGPDRRTQSDHGTAIMRMAI